MHRLSAPSAPLVVFLIVMTGGSGILNPSILVFSGVATLRSWFWCPLYALERLRVGGCEPQLHRAWV